MKTAYRVILGLVLILGMATVAEDGFIASAPVAAPEETRVVVVEDKMIFVSAIDLSRGEPSSPLLKDNQFIQSQVTTCR